MTFFSILCALLIEQLKPLRADNQVYGPSSAWPRASKAGSTQASPATAAWAGA
jgi:hypothetical protein